MTQFFSDIQKTFWSITKKNPRSMQAELCCYDANDL